MHIKGILETMKNRVGWIDICKGIGILFVILGHCNTPYNKLVYGFHMPLFFIISGYLFTCKEWKKIIKDNISRYLVPYFVLCIINLILYSPLDYIKNKGETHLLKYIVGIIYSRGTVEWMPNCSPLWFLTAIFVALLIYTTISKIRKKVFREVFVAICMIIGYGLYLCSVPKLLWNIDTAFMAVLYLEFGHIVKQKNFFRGVIKSYQFFRLHY